MNLEPLLDLSLLSAMGPAFALGFAGLTSLAAWQYLSAGALADEATRLVDGLLNGVEPGLGGASEPMPGSALARWQRLACLKGELNAVTTRAAVATNAIPTLALLGTCLGFFHALGAAAAITGRGKDAMEMVVAMLDGGIATALGATVCGQALFLVLSQAWSLWFARRVEVAAARLDECLLAARPALAIEEVA